MHTHTMCVELEKNDDLGERERRESLNSSLTRLPQDIHTCIVWP